MIAYTESCPVRQGVFNGGIAQLARACGSYPQCPRFKSRCRYQTPKDGTAPSFGTSLQEYPAPLGQPGPLVKWLRHRPFTAVTRVRVPYGSPIYGGVAQPVEHLTFNQRARDSSSLERTKIPRRIVRFFVDFPFSGVLHTFAHFLRTGGKAVFFLALSALLEFSLSRTARWAGILLLLGGALHGGTRL